MIVPLLQVPDWCINYYRDRQDTRLVRPIYECTEVDGGTVRYSQLPKLAPYITAVLDFICLAILVVFKCYKTSWRKQDKYDKLRNYGITALFIISVIDLLIAIGINRYPWVANLLRPFVVLIFLKTIRNNIYSVLLDLRQSLVILFCIFAYITCYSVIGFYAFRYTNQNASVFLDLQTTYY